MNDEELKTLVLSIADPEMATPVHGLGVGVTLTFVELHRLVAKVRSDVLEEAAEYFDRQFELTKDRHNYWQSAAISIRSMK